MRKTILMSFLALFLLAGTAAAAEAPVAAAKDVVAEVCSPEEGAAGPDEVAPEKDGEVLPGALPQPLFVCKAGACSNDEQCQEWLQSPWAVCVKEPGHGCGYCIEL